MSNGARHQVAVLSGSIGAHEKWARCDDRTAATSAARAKFNDRFLAEADPDNTLPVAERVIRADHLRSAYFKRLALASVMARRRNGSKQVETVSVPQSVPVVAQDGGTHAALRTTSLRVRPHDQVAPGRRRTAVH